MLLFLNRCAVLGDVNVMFLDVLSDGKGLDCSCNIIECAYLCKVELQFFTEDDEWKFLVEQEIIFL